MGIASKISAAASVALCCSAASPASAQVLQPVEKWHADFGETQCTAARSFNTPSGLVTLGLVPGIGAENYQLQVMIPQPGPAYAQELRGTVDLGNGPTKRWMLHFGGQGVQMSAYQTTLSAADVEQLRSATALTVAPDKGGVYSFALSEMPALLDGLKKCTSTLQQYWNMNSPTATPAAPAKPIASLFKANDYPTEAAKKQQQGTVRYNLLIDDKGAVAGCDLAASSGFPILDETGCEVIKQKAKFRPATDTQGKAVRSVWPTPAIPWKLGSRAEAQGSDPNCMYATTGQLGPSCSRGFRDSTQTQKAPPPPPPPQPH